MVLLLTYFLQGGLVVTHGTVANSELDCKAAAPLMKDLALSDKLMVAGRQYKIMSIDAQCIKVPAETSI